LKGEGAISQAQAVAVQLSFEAPGLLEDALAGRADVKLAGAALGIDQLSGTVSRGKFGGHVSVDFASKPLIKAELDLARLNLVAADAAAGSGASGDVTPGRASAGAPWSDRRTDLDALKFFDADVKISVGEFNYGMFRAAPASVQATVAAGMLRTQFPRLGLYGGQADGTLLVDASDAEPNYALQVNLTGVRALPLLSDLADFSSVDGRLQAKIDVHAAGSSPRALISTLGGSTDVLLQDGEVRGINIARMVRELMGTTLTGWQASKAEKTDLTELRALFRLSNGQATTRNLQMLGPLVRMTGQGTADLNAKTLDFKLEPKLVMSLEGQGGAANPSGLGVPVIVQGPWSEPRIYPDVAGILDHPDAAFDKLRQLGGALFGKQGSGGGPDVQIPGLGNFFGRGNARNDDSRRSDSGNDPAGSGKNANPRDAQTPNINGIIRDLFGR
jgi:AsmA protein